MTSIVSNPVVLNVAGSYSYHVIAVTLTAPPCTQDAGIHVWRPYDFYDPLDKQEITHCPACGCVRLVYPDRRVVYFDRNRGTP